MNSTENTIQQTAMLMTLSIRQWSGRVTDKSASSNLANDKGAACDAVKVSKRLVFCKLTEDIKKLANDARQEFYALTLPWMDDGRRLLSAKSYAKAMGKMAHYQSRFDKFVAQTEQQYPSMIDEARRNLGDLFRESDYPACISLKYLFLPRVEPIPSVDDIRIGLGDGERAKIAANMRAQIDAAARMAKKDIYERTAECVGRIAESLAKFDPDAKGAARGTFRDSLIGNVADLLDGLDGLNFDDDQNIKSLGDRLRALTIYQPQELREDENKRRQTAQTAIEIMETMAGYCGVYAPAATSINAS
jgi:hypothetical protein